ncbi:MAG: hypothetical protein H7Y60_17015 [Rhodospirillaceae bacterium]|nr:hypothetical protein [Rhodospirillales bacterium]
MRWLVVTACLLTTAAQAEDMRAFQHGISLVTVSEARKLVFWSSAVGPPGPDGNWSHDVFVADAGNPAQHKPIITAPEAQEPASAAISTDGRIMVTMEDGWNTDSETTQRFGLYNSDLSPVAAYPQLVAEGGHSGHVAAAGRRFVVFYSDGWVKGGGVDNLGSGQDVMVRLFDSDGRLQRHVAVASGKRDWWPLVASSDRRALLVWQRFVKGQTHAKLMMAVLDPASGTLVTAPKSLAELMVRYYTYAVTWIPATRRFLVTGTTKTGTGFACLLDEQGRVLTKRTDFAPMVREAWPAVNGTNVVTLTAPTGAMLLSVAGDRITPLRQYADPTPWAGIGAAADLGADGKVRVYSLSERGLVLREWGE